MVSFSHRCLEILPPFTCPRSPASVRLAASSIPQTMGQGHSCGQVWSHPALCLATLDSAWRVPHCIAGSALWVLMPIPDHSGSRWVLEGTSFLSRCRSSALSPCWLLRFWVRLPPLCLEVILFRNPSGLRHLSSLSATPKAFFGAYSDKVISLSVITKGSGPYLTYESGHFLGPKT